MRNKENKINKKNELEQNYRKIHWLAKVFMDNPWSFPHFVMLWLQTLQYFGGILQKIT